MAFASTYNTVSVAATATVIMASNPERKGCIIFNTANQTVFLGMDASVTTSTGLPLPANSSLSNSGFGEAWKGAIYGIVVSNTADCRYWEWGP